MRKSSLSASDVAHIFGVFVITLAGDKVSAITRFDNSVIPHFGLPRKLPGKPGLDQAPQLPGPLPQWSWERRRGVTEATRRRNREPGLTAQATVPPHGPVYR
jgi:hypothetical protein